MSSSIAPEARDILRKLITYGFSNLDQKNKKWMIADFQKSTGVTNEQLEDLLFELNNKVLS